MEFLLARIAEDEAHWQRTGRYARDCQECAALSDHEPGPTVDQMLAECAAKRAIVARLDLALETARPATAFHVGAALRALANVYAGHASFQEEWKP